MSRFMARLNLYDVPYVAKSIQYTFYTKPIFALKKRFLKFFVAGEYNLQ